MWYVVLYAVLAGWVFLDALARRCKGTAVVWTLGTLVCGPVVLPFYLARRPLRIGETRKGGTSWNVLSNFAILWTIVMAIVGISTLISMASVTSGVKSGPEAAGAGVGIVLGVGFLAFAWFVPTFGAALIGFLLKKNSVVERGPTGALAGDTSGTSVLSGWLGLVGASFLALVLILVLTARNVRSSMEASDRYGIRQRVGSHIRC